MHTTVYIAMSVDGFIARKNGDVDWLGAPTPEAMEDFAQLMASIDCVVIGRATYEKVRSFGEWPYTKPVVVLTSRDLEIPSDLIGSVQTLSGSVREVGDELASQGFEKLYIDGGRTIRSFLNERLVDRLVLTTAPVLLGEGVPLFGPLRTDANLQHVTTRVLTGGFVQSEYRMA